MTDTSAAAAALLRAHDTRTPFRAIGEQFSLDDLPAAYDVQDEFVRLLRERRGCGLVGYKIGLTSPRMQAFCGIPHPVAGAILDDRVHASGAVVPLTDHVHLGVEFEIAVRIGRDIDAATLPSGLEEMSAAVSEVAPALELVDDRHADYTALDMLTVVADNAWNAGVVLGEFRTSWPDLSAIEGVVAQNGQDIDRGFGRDVLGHPFEPALWLARHLAARGQSLPAGAIVMTGSLVTTRFPAARSSYRFRLEGLGAVEATFA